MPPDARPRQLGVVSRQPEDYIRTCSVDEFEGFMITLELIEKGDFSALPIADSYLYPDANSIITSEGLLVIFSVRDEPEPAVFNILHLGVLRPPPDVVDGS